MGIAQKNNLGCKMAWMVKALHGVPTPDDERAQSGQI